MNDVVNVIDANMMTRIHSFRPRWNTRQFRLNHAWIRILAGMLEDDLHLATSESIENWMAHRGGKALTTEQKQMYFRVVERTVGILEQWHELGADYSAAIVADVGWAVLTFGTQNGQRVDLASSLGMEVARTVAHCQYPGLTEADWKGGTNMNGYNNVRMRRELIAAIIHKNLPGAPKVTRVVRKCMDNTHSGVMRATQEEADAARALLDLLTPHVAEVNEEEEDVFEEEEMDIMEEPLLETGLAHWEGVY